MERRPMTLTVLNMLFFHLYNIPAFQHSSLIRLRPFSLDPRHSLTLLFQLAHAVGDVLAQAHERAAMGGGERVVALVRCCLADGGAARL